MVDSNDLQQTVCQLADAAVSQERIRDYGHPKDNFADIASVWTTLLRKNGIQLPITAQQVGSMMIALKLCRNMEQPKRDNLVDICGFAKCIDLVNNSQT